MEDNVIWLFGRKVKPVRNDNDYTCNGCALKDICDNNLVDINEYICTTNDNSRQKFVKAE